MGIDKTFTCKGCNCIVPEDFSMRTADYCYLCDPAITLDELLSNNPITPDHGMKEKPNHIEFNKDDGPIELTLTRSFLKIFQEVFNCEKEVLEGKIYDEPDGRVKCIITLSGEKREMFDKFVEELISKSGSNVELSVMGVPFNPN